MTVLDYVELFFSTVLFSVRGHDSARFVKGPAFASFPEATITVTSSDCGASGSQMSIHYTQEGKDLFPQLSWTPVPGTQEYLLIVQDVDAPMPSPIMHGLFHAIPADKTSVSNEEIQPLKGTKGKPEGTDLKGGFKRGSTLTGAVYHGPRALKGHGPHKYYFMVVALSEKVDLGMGGPIAKGAELAKLIKGNVLGWGEWVGISERKWA